MESISEFKQTWRVASLALLILAFAGPWTYDVINVPAEYSCSPPNIRLEGDFCGMPLLGSQVIFFLFQGFISITMGFLSGAADFAGSAREYFLTLIFLLLLAPFLGTAFVLWKKDSRRLQAFHLLAWCLAAILGLYWSMILVASPHPYKFSLWGVWVYMGLAIGILALEALALAPRKEVGQQV